MIIAVTETRRENLIYALPFARLDEFRLALFGGCAKAGSECNTTAALRRRHECRCTGEQRDCGENLHVANFASFLSQHCGPIELAAVQAGTSVSLH